MTDDRPSVPPGIDLDALADKIAERQRVYFQSTLTTEEAAARLGRSVRFVHRLVSSGRLQRLDVLGEDGASLFSARELERAVDDCPRGGPRQSPNPKAPKVKARRGRKSAAE